MGRNFVSGLFCKLKSKQEIRAMAGRTARCILASLKSRRGTAKIGPYVKLSRLDYVFREKLCLAIV